MQSCKLFIFSFKQHLDICLQHIMEYVIDAQGYFHHRNLMRMMMAPLLGETLVTLQH